MILFGSNSENKHHIRYSDIAKFNLVDLETVYQYMRNIANTHGYDSLQEYGLSMNYH